MEPQWLNEIQEFFQTLDVKHITYSNVNVDSDVGSVLNAASAIDPSRIHAISESNASHADFIKLINGNTKFGILATDSNRMQIPDGISGQLNAFLNRPAWVGANTSKLRFASRGTLGAGYDILRTCLWSQESAIRCMVKFDDYIFSLSAVLYVLAATNTGSDFVSKTKSHMLAAAVDKVCQSGELDPFVLTHARALHVFLTTVIGNTTTEDPSKIFENFVDMQLRDSIVLRYKLQGGK